MSDTNSSGKRYWRSLAELDHAPEFEESLIKNVTRFEISAYDDRWTEKWPPERSDSQQQPELEELPQAVRIFMEVEDYGRFTVMISGVGS